MNRDISKQRNQRQKVIIICDINYQIISLAPKKKKKTWEEGNIHALCFGVDWETVLGFQSNMKNRLQWANFYNLI